MKYIYLLFTVLAFAGCSTFEGSINKTQYMKADKVIYEKVFGERIVITDLDKIQQLVNIIGSAKRENTDFVPQEQLIFIASRDTLSIQRGGSYLKDGRGTYRLGAYMTDELNKFLGK
ncbi:MAG: hypothetical protein LBV71_05120 [Prevotella sp.]|jgi:hypothetical protein|nr:hypothetical protein [Prevotella sp.]